MKVLTTFFEGSELDVRSQSNHSVLSILPLKGEKWAFVLERATLHIYIRPNIGFYHTVNHRISDRPVFKWSFFGHFLGPVFEWLWQPFCFLPFKNRTKKSGFQMVWTVFI
jgi:hypothetical protein